MVGQVQPLVLRVRKRLYQEGGEVSIKTTWTLSDELLTTLYIDSDVVSSHSVDI